ncbi:MAG: hypothetical protein OM95_01615 [Bdellovibrio sp. ArHS]|uniref:KH domain-containing protein n=1 Tax=Bdellovibrio sp. ArHS TaxID=1569284 RepID=UPI000583BDC4|nr:KH domain-containing protein [Bdellovibrio sp. ArHS]KHD89795.1 MAG: hypothetical protein OM95_01615 [Bdellovibrio sp. ArHS]
MKVIKRSVVLDFPESEDSKVERERVRQFLLEALQLVVGNTTQMDINIELGERTTVYRVACPQEVIGRLMGKKGRNIEALRALLTPICYNYGFRAVIEIPFYPQNPASAE